MIKARKFGEAPDGSPVQRIDISSGGATASVLTWGAILCDFRLAGIDRSLVLGAPDFAPYLGSMGYFGAIVGPVANRIAGGRMTVAGQEVHLDRNEKGVTTLHGGAKGFGSRNWRVVDVAEAAVTLGLNHPDGQCGFPGNLGVSARYSIDKTGALTLEITGASDAPTWFGPAFHGYWNLDGKPDLSGHKLTIPAETYLPVDDNKLPLGDPVTVAGTKFDYRASRQPATSLDHNFCLGEHQGRTRLACVLEAADLRLEVETTEVGLQVYTGGKMNTAPHVGHTGQPYGANAGIALEPQFWPDTPNHPTYPSSALVPGRSYRQVSRFAVSRSR